MKAPDPDLTSKTRASAPSATFLDRMEAVMRGMDSTVAVTSRRRVELLVGGTISSGLACHGEAVAGDEARKSASVKGRAVAGYGLELVEGAAGVAEGPARHHRGP